MRIRQQVSPGTDLAKDVSSESLGSGKNSSGHVISNSKVRWFIAIIILGTILCIHTMFSITVGEDIRGLFFFVLICSLIFIFDLIFYSYHQRTIYSCY